MTMTEARPETSAGPPPDVVASPARDSWFTTSDHKRLGLITIYAALLFLLVAGVLGMILRIQLSEPTSDIAGNNYGRLFSMHATTTVLLFLGPIWVGLATYLVPLQIGSGRLALPRLHATAVWLYIVGGVLLVASYISGPPLGSGLGITAAGPPIANGPASRPTDLWIASLMVLAAATMLASVSLLTTVATLRAEGMTFLRVPAFSWAVAASSAVTVLTTPVFLAGLTLLYLDQRFGGGFFGAPGSRIVWQHAVWMFGRPEIFLLTLPALGAACDIVTTHARRPLVSHTAGLVALGAFAVLSLTSWTAGTHTSSAVVVPTYTPATALVAAPVGILVLLWLGTLRLGRPRLHVSVLYVAGFVLLLLTGAANAIAAAVAKVPAGTAWTVGNLHTVAFGAPALLAFGAMYHWGPKIWGRTAGQGVAAVVFLLLFGGFFVNGMANYILGYQGAPAHAKHLAGEFSGMSRVAAVGGVLIVLGALVFVADLARSLARRGDAVADDPYEGLTLEWATTSPPAPNGFDTVPEVRSEAPLVHTRTSTNGTVA